MTAQQLAREWENGDIVACKQSIAAAQRHLKKELEIETHNSLVGLIEYARFHERENYSFKNWKQKK